MLLNNRYAQHHPDAYHCHVGHRNHPKTGKRVTRCSSTKTKKQKQTYIRTGQWLGLANTLYKLWTRMITNALYD